jgi:hypothetical protein
MIEAARDAERAGLARLRVEGFLKARPWIKLSADQLAAAWVGAPGESGPDVYTHVCDELHRASYADDFHHLYDPEGEIDS